MLSRDLKQRGFKTRNIYKGDEKVPKINRIQGGQRLGAVGSYYYLHVAASSVPETMAAQRKLGPQSEELSDRNRKPRRDALIAVENR